MKIGDYVLFCTPGSRSSGQDDIYKIGCIIKGQPADRDFYIKELHNYDYWTSVVCQGDNHYTLMGRRFVPAPEHLLTEALLASLQEEEYLISKEIGLAEVHRYIALLRLKGLEDVELVEKA